MVFILILQPLPLAVFKKSRGFHKVMLAFHTVRFAGFKL